MLGAAAPISSRRQPETLARALAPAKSSLFPFNHGCTYQAELSKGSDLEKASYVLTAKQKVVKLVCHWVALYGLLLKEHPAASDFLEVRLQI